MKTPLVVAAVLALLCAGSAGASDAAMIAGGDAAAERAEDSFRAFTAEWMDRALARSHRDSQAPRAQQAASGLRFTYRAVDETFETELRPTGRPASPYVGVLHYTEHTYVCEDVHATSCRNTSSLPVTEVFRYRDGKWTY